MCSGDVTLYGTVKSVKFETVKDCSIIFPITIKFEMEESGVFKKLATSGIKTDKNGLLIISTYNIDLGRKLITFLNKKVYITGRAAWDNNYDVHLFNPKDVSDTNESLEQFAFDDNF